MQTRVAAAFVALPVLLPLASAQLREAGQPASARSVLPVDVPTLVLPADTRGMRVASESLTGGRFRYGVELTVGHGLEDSGRWDTVAETGELVWRLELVSPGAFSLGVLFERFDLPRGAHVFLYDPARSEVLGAYGESTENPNGVLAVQPLRGDRVVIEYVEPPGTLERPELVVGTLVHDYLDVLARMAQGSILAASCLVDVNCSLGATHQDIKRAVIWMFSGGGGCSGSILNNTAEDATPYMMTAEHCGNMTNAVYVFDYERTGCGTGTSSQSKTLSGSTQLAVSSQYDGQLYRLNQSIPASYQPFFAGWSLITPLVGPTFGISHPGGQPKKIQLDWQAPLVFGTRWNVENDIGAVQPGSSGSPLFDRNERVIGSCSTGAGGCTAFSNYGRFDQFYALKNLATWLDPLGWGLHGIDGYDPIAPYTHKYTDSGANPTILSALDDPRLGATFHAQVDASSRPSATQAILYGYGAPADGPDNSTGELLLDFASPRHFQRFAPVSGGLATFTMPLPNDIALAGLASYTQAFVIGGGTIATNGLKLVLNF